MRFIIWSDLHFGSSKISPPKLMTLQHILDENPDIIINCGDLTDSGSGVGTFKIGLLDMSHFPCYKLKDDNWSEFETKWIMPIESKGIKLLLCHGNHDTYSKKYPFVSPVVKQIINKYGNTHYIYENSGIKFYVCGEYPNNAIISWLASELKKCSKDAPIILIFHYNIVGEMSDWWLDTEKQTLYNLIKDYNILGIFYGHLHQTHKYTWGEKNIKCYCTSGLSYIIADYVDNVLTIKCKKYDRITRILTDADKGLIVID